MPKFYAASIRDLMTAERNAGRVARKCPYIVAVEADDGSWCELDATSLNHGFTLATNWVDKMNARGASVWEVKPSGKLGRLPLLLILKNGNLAIKPIFCLTA